MRVYNVPLSFDKALLPQLLERRLTMTNDTSSVHRYVMRLPIIHSNGSGEGCVFYLTVEVFNAQEHYLSFA